MEHNPSALNISFDMNLLASAYAVRSFSLNFTTVVHNNTSVHILEMKLTLMYIVIGTITGNNVVEHSLLRSRTYDAEKGTCLRHCF